MHVRPMTGALGADVHDVDVSTALDDDTVRDLHDALVRFGVIVIREQALTPRQQLDFVRRFGDIHLHPHVHGLPDVPEVMEILKTEEETINFGSEWHTDQSFLPEPAMATCLYACELPDAGGDTLFACMRGGFRSLSPGLQRLALGLRTVNLSVAARLARSGGRNTSTYASMRARDAEADEPAVEHPLVRRHPVSGEPALYIGLHTQGFAGFADEEGAILKGIFMRHLTRPENTCRVRWTPGALALWDNRSVLHKAVNDYQGKRRRMHRITVAGDRPRAWQPPAD